MGKIDPRNYGPFTHITSGGRFVLSGNGLPVFNEGDEVTVSQGDRLVFFGVVERSDVTTLILVSPDYSLDQLHQVSVDVIFEEILTEYAEAWERLAR